MAQPGVIPARVLSIQGSTNAWFTRPGWAAERPLRAHQALEATDIVRTGERTRLLLQLADRTITQVPELSRFRVERRPAGRTGVVFTLWRGLAYFFHRDRPDDLRIDTQTASAAIRGTDFSVEVDDQDRMTVSLLDGEVELRNQQGSIHLVSGEQGRAEPGRTPFKTAVLSGVNQIQWCLYYPGVLDLEELPLTAEENGTLQESLDAYRSGDLQRALARYPAGREPESPQEAVYWAALHLSVGNVEATHKLLQRVIAPPAQMDTRVARLAEALRVVIAAVKQELRRAPVEPLPSTRLASEWLAESYALQARGQLAEALQAARQAVEASPRFGFAWVRVAELEFSFARTPKAAQALEQGLAFSPRNAQAVALKGFLLAAQNQVGRASAQFDQAIELDGGLGNAWLGRGLCRLHQGLRQAGLTDLEVAAAVEPQRALLRSYLGKAFDEVRDARRARHELDLAKELDPNDPTAWLYSALMLQRDNRINAGVRDLEKSKEINNHRSVYRSQLLLDQDRAVRGANLAAIYRDAGMTEVSVREAVRAVETDYANFSAHYFLADSYNDWRDPSQVNLRYETPWFTEYLLATLLAPAGGGTLSPVVSQHEYSRLFDRNRLGLFSQTEYASSGDWYQTAVQHGQYNNSSYAAEVSYHSRNGHRPNNDLEQLALTLRLKHQLTARDGLFFQATCGEAEGGDLSQYYDEAWASPALRVEETQGPMLLAGYHREWRPGRHTLLLAGYVDDTLKYSNPTQHVLLVQQILDWHPIPALSTARQQYRNDVEFFTVELQQIEQWGPHTLILGGRYQQGTFRTRSEQSDPFYPSLQIEEFPPQDFSTDFGRLTFYGYDQWKLFPSISLIAGVSYDAVTFPSNFRFPPISADEETRDQVSPKGGLIWNPHPNTVIRAAYAQALGGVSLDQSFRLEPPQVAGFIQTPRSLIPESAEGYVPVPSFELAGVSLEQKFGRGTYLGLSEEWLRSEAERTIGAVQAALWTGQDGYSQTGTPQELDFQENTLIFTASQLIADEWSVGLRYRLSEATLDKQFPEMLGPASSSNPLRRPQHLEAILHQVQLVALYNHPCGFFAQFQALWFAQSNQGYVPDQPGDDFWQFNAWIGYRFLQRRAEVRLGLLNLTDQDYRLNPLNLTPEWPHDRTFVASLMLNF